MTKRQDLTLKGFLWQNVGLVVFATLLFVVLAILNIGDALADDVIDVVRVGVPVSCSLEGTGMNSHTITMNGNSTESAIGETILKAYCNDVNGFSIYAIGFTDDIEGKNVLTSSALGSTYDIHTGTATSGANSTWAMKLSTVTSPTPNFPITIQNSFNAFHDVPDDYTLVASRTASTDIGAAAEGSTLKTTYQAYVSSSQPAGTYIGQVKYVLVHPYNATAPRKPLTISDIEYMQDFSDLSASQIEEVLDSMTDEQAYLVPDIRDEEEYYIAKLADDNIWMIDNLRLGGTTSINLTSDNTNIVNDFTLPASSLNCFTSSSCTNGGVSGNGYTVASINADRKNATVVVGTGQGSKKYGVYYNYCAASGGTVCTESNPTVSQYSVCPSGWRLPTGNNSGEYKALYDSYSGSTSEYQRALSTGDTGYIQGGNFMDGGGVYWTATKYGSMYMIVAQANAVFTNDKGNYMGNSIRCIVDK